MAICSGILPSHLFSPHRSPNLYAHYFFATLRLLLLPVIVSFLHIL
jgi:hypothetical protein